jgi:hypothetical protein
MQLHGTDSRAPQTDLLCTVETTDVYLLMQLATDFLKTR